MEHKVIAFGLENFMGFEDTGWIDLKPITLLFGRNSTGKSALIRALLLLRQSVDSDGNINPLIFADENGTDVGTFWDFVRDHDETREVVFYFKVKLDDKQVQEINLEEIKDLDRKKAYPVIIIAIHFGLVNAKLGLKKFSVELDVAQKNEYRSYEYMNLGIKLINSSKNIAKWIHVLNPSISLRNPHQELLSEELWERTTPKYHKGFIPYLHVDDQTSDLTNAQNQNNDEDKGKTTDKEKTIVAKDLAIVNNTLFYIRKELDQFLNQVVYIGPIRSEPKRFYYVPQKVHKDVGKQGEHVAQTYLAAKNQNSARIADVAKWVEKIVPESQFDVVSVSEYLSDLQKEQPVKLPLPEVPLHLMLLKGKDTFKTNLRDVGFGVSQVLPVIVQSLLAEEGSTIIIEQPELHLHPRAQAELADMFIEQTKRGVRFIIETHSEHLLLRMRRRIAETTAETEDILEKSDLMLDTKALGIYFIDRYEGESFCQSIQLNQLGGYEYVPHTFRRFFADDTDEVLILNRAARKAYNHRQEKNEFHVTPSD